MASGRLLAESQIGVSTGDAGRARIRRLLPLVRVCLGAQEMVLHVEVTVLSGAVGKTRPARVFREEGRFGGWRLSRG